MKRIIIVALPGILLVIIMYSQNIARQKNKTQPSVSTQQNVTSVPSHPLTIESMRKREYPGSNIAIEQTLPSEGNNYFQYLTSYISDGLKIYALLTVPKGEKPASGWPVIVFNHGYIPPEVYKTTERYVAYVDAFARNGYIVFKPDYRGNGSSEGQPEGAYYSPAYTTDVLNAISSIKRYTDANPEYIGMWGHSMGGNITLRSVVVRPNALRAAVIWGGVVGSYTEMQNDWKRTFSFQPSQREQTVRGRFRQQFIALYKTPQQNPDFWNSIDPTYFVSSITTPIQLHHGQRDEDVPVSFSESLYNKLQQTGKQAELYIYQGADHNISNPSFTTAIKRSLEFFDTYLKTR